MKIKNTIFILFLLLAIFLPLGLVRGANQPASPLEIYKADYLKKNTDMWAWLENLKTGKITADFKVTTPYRYSGDPKNYLEMNWIKNTQSRPVKDVLSEIFLSWRYPWHCTDVSDYTTCNPFLKYPPYGAASYWGQKQELAMFIWILYRYSDQIYPADRDAIENYVKNRVSNRNSQFGAGSENSQIAEGVGRYVYATDHKDLTLSYMAEQPNNYQIHSFAWNGKTYNPGQSYNAYEFCRDWLFFHMNDWVKNGNRELDSPPYTHMIIENFITLFEFAKDPDMKKRAKMTADFLLLDSAMDHSANQWGGELGRTYENYYTSGRGAFPWKEFFGTSDPETSGITRHFLVGSYRLAVVIQDAGNLDDEPDNYWHLNLESKNNKWNYVTKYFNLGGSLGSWLLNILSPSLPFNFWINIYPNEETVAGVGTNRYLPYQGQYGHQYRNAMYVMPVSNGQRLYPHFHISGSWDQIKEDRPTDRYGWKFYKKDKAMFAYNIQNFGSQDEAALEVAIEGVDYKSFDDFVAAVRQNTRIDYQTNSYTTSKGDTIRVFNSSVSNADMPAGVPNPADKRGGFYAAIKKAGQTKYEWIWNFPFKRIETVDNNGNHIVAWDNNVMTVSRHNKTCKYDFNTNWTYSGNGCEGAGASVYLADFNSDGQVDISDFGILLSNWNKTSNLKFKEKNLDLAPLGAPDSLIDVKDLGAFLSCWGAPDDKGVCLDK
jgi:hypothetical protein